MVNAIIIIFIIVPNPGLSFNGIQKTKTMQLIMKVDRPIPILTFLATPSAKTVQGVTPFWEITKILSPKPNKNKPKQRKEIVRAYSDYWGVKWFMIQNIAYGDWEGALYNFDYSLSPDEVNNARLENLKPLR